MSNNSGGRMYIILFLNPVGKNANTSFFLYTKSIIIVSCSFFRDLIVKEYFFVRKSRNNWDTFMSTELVYFINNEAVLSQRWPHYACYICGSNEPLRRYGHSKLSKMAAYRQLGFDVTGNSAIRSADPENLTLEPNTNCYIGSRLGRYGHSRILGHMEPPFWGKGRS